MFLYAKVVLSNLLDQPTLGDFEREIEEENFPQGMDEAYSSKLFIVTEHSRANYQWRFQLRASGRQHSRKPS